jgi:hypothetical protein
LSTTPASLSTTPASLSTTPASLPATPASLPAASGHSPKNLVGVAKARALYYENHAQRLSAALRATW